MTIASKNVQMINDITAVDSGPMNIIHTNSITPHVAIAHAKVNRNTRTLSLLMVF